MHIHTIEQWNHSHNFYVDRGRAEKNTQIVMVLVAIAMIVEIITGIAFGSMALLADGWHMLTHIAAFGITIFAYRYARDRANDPQYTFGTGKVSALGGFASAIALGVIAFVMAIESVARFFQPHDILFNEAIAVAIIGLLVNLISAWLLDGGEESHHHHHHHHHDDTNLHAAYIHVLADALTSVLAIVALLAGKFAGWVWMDAAMGLVGAVVIVKWADTLIRETSSMLLDGAVDRDTKLAITSAIESDSDNRIVDLHVWYVSEHHLSATIALVTHFPQPPEHYKKLLACIPSLVHAIVEVNPCHGEPCLAIHSEIESANLRSD